MRGDAEGGRGAAPRTVAYAFASCSSCAGAYDPPASFLIACSSASAVSLERSLRFSPDMGTDDSRPVCQVLLDSFSCGKLLPSVRWSSMLAAELQHV